jgi:hypothetical protein
LVLESQIDGWKEEWNLGVVEIRLADGRKMLLDDAVPDTRGDCPTLKPCPHIRCRFHLWRVDGGELGTRAGRPGLSAVPRDERGMTISVPGDVAGQRPGTTLEARWLESPVPQSCALDVAAAGERSNLQAASDLGRHRTLVGREVKRAMARAIEAARKMGMSAEELMRGMRQLREENGR